jgi:hypothetical protein
MTPGRNADTIWLAQVVDDTGSVSLGLRRIGSDGTASFLVFLCIRTMDLRRDIPAILLRDAPVLR